MRKLFSIALLIGYSIIGNSQCISGPSAFNVGQTYTFTSTATAQCTSCYDWDINNNSASSDNSTVGNLQIVGSDIGQSVSIKVLSAGSFSIQLTYFDETGCHSCSQTFNPMPTINCFGFDPTNNQSNVNENYGFVNFTANSVSSTGITFTWYFRFYSGTVLVLNGQNPTFDVVCPSNPVMSFALLVTNGVTTKRYYSPHSSGNYPISGFTAPTPTCFTHLFCNDLLEAKTGQQDSIKVYPNPTSTLLKFEGKGLNNYTISIFDNKGKEVIANSGMENDINLEKLINGIYIYKIYANDKVIQEGKVIKQ